MPWESRRSNCSITHIPMRKAGIHYQFPPRLREAGARELIDSRLLAYASASAVFRRWALGERFMQQAI